MYRLLIETLLGVNLVGDKLRLTPHLPKDWTTSKIHYHYRQTVYHITINRFAADPAEANQLFLDGKELAVELLPLVDDRREHFVELKVWTPVNTPENRSVLLTAV
jgi:cellobiose phosphorylase